MSVVIYSSLAEDQQYMLWTKAADRIIPGATVLIKGGHNKWDNTNLCTPHGIVNRVSESDYEILKQVPQFNDHVKNGFLVVSQKEHAPEVVVTDMNPEDKSSQLSEADIDAMSPVIEDARGKKHKIKRKKEKAEALEYV